MKKFFLLINVIVALGCESTILRQDILPSETMVELLVDIHILEARVDKLRLTKDSAHAVYNTLELEIFEKNKVDKKEYEKSYQYYLSDPKTLDKIYAIVVDSLNVIQKRGYKEDVEFSVRQEKIANIDSIARTGGKLGKFTLPKDSLLKR